MGRKLSNNGEDFGRIQQTPPRIPPTPKESSPFHSNGHSRRPYFGIDFGKPANTGLYDEVVGPVELVDLNLPRTKPPSKFFPALVERVIELGRDPILEVTAINSSGVEQSDLEDVVGRYPEVTIYGVDSSATMNYRKTIGKMLSKDKRGKKPKESNMEDAKFIVEIVTLTRYKPCVLASGGVWRADRIRYDRAFNHPRPYDQREYDDPFYYELEASLIPYHLLPSDVIHCPIGLNGKYRPLLAMPFAAVFREIDLDVFGSLVGIADRFERLVGFTSSFGYGCYYRKMWNYWMRLNAGAIRGIMFKKNDTIPKDILKDAEILSRWEIRRMFHLQMSHLRPDYPSYTGTVTKPKLRHYKPVIAARPSPKVLRGTSN